MASTGPGVGNPSENKTEIKIEVPDRSDDNEDSQSVSSEASSSSDDEPKKRKSYKKRKAETKEEDEVPLKKINIDKLTLKILPMQTFRRNATTLAEKLRILERIKSGESQGNIATSLKLNRSTIQHIWAERDKYETCAREMGTHRKRCRKPTFIELEKLVISWVEYMQQQGTPANGPQICEHAKVLARGMGIDNFSGSSGWLSSFRNRNNVAVPKMRKFFPNGTPRKVKPKSTKSGNKKGEEMSFNDNNDSYEDHDNDDWVSGVTFEDAMIGQPGQAGNAEDDAAGASIKSKVLPSSKKLSFAAKPAKKVPNKWITESWVRLSNGYEPKDIFFLDEFGLFYRAPPEDYKQFQGLSCFDGEAANERLGVIIGVNALGTEKLKLAVIGSSPYPSSFGQNWNQSQQDKLPTEYWFHPKSFITADTVSSRLSRWNDKLEASGRKVLVLMASSRVHQTVQTLCSTLSCISLVVLPAALGASPVNQLETDISSELKTNYKKYLLNKLIRKRESRDNTLRISILEACGLLYAAWESLDEQFIADVFTKAGLVKETKDANGEKRKERISVKNLIQTARAVGLKFPKELSFKTFVDIDENLVAVDASTGIIDGRNNLLEDDEPPCLTPPPGPQLLNSLDHLRNWAVTAASTKELKGFHEAIYLLQNFCTNHIPSQPTALPSAPTTTTSSKKSSAPFLSTQQQSNAQSRARTLHQDNESTSSSTYSTVDARTIQLGNATSSGGTGSLYGTPSLATATNFTGNQQPLNYFISNGQIQELTAAANLLQQQQHQTHHHNQYYHN